MIRIIVNEIYSAIFIELHIVIDAIPDNRINYFIIKSYIYTKKWVLNCML